MAGCNSCYNPAKRCHSACDPVFTKVDVLPEPYLATHGHAYITPDDKVYVLDHEGVEFVLLNSVGGTTKTKNIRDVTPTEGGYSINYTDGTNDIIRIPKQITYDIQGDYLVASNGAEYRLPKSEDTNTTYTIEGNELVGSDGARVPLPKQLGTIFATDIVDLLNQDQENPREVGTFAAIFTDDFKHELYIKDGVNSWNAIADFGRDTTYTIEGTTLVSSNGDRQEIPQPDPYFFGDGLLISEDNIVTLDPAFLPPDNYVKDVRVSRTGNVVKLTYTYVDETTKEVEFTDNDTVALTYDDTELRNLIQGIRDVIGRLETKEDKDTIYDDSDIKRRLSFTDSQIQNLREIVNRLEARREAPEIRAGSAISVDGGTISVNPDFPLFRVDPASPPSSLNDMARRVLTLLKRTDKDTIYNDSEIKTQLGLLRTELANIRNSTRNYDDTQIRNLINNLQTSVTALQQRRDNDTIYNDAEVRKLISDLTVTVRNIQQNSTRYDDTQLRTLITNLERRIVSYTGGSGINISGGTVSLNVDGATIPVGTSTVSLKTLGNMVHTLNTRVDKDTTYRIDKGNNALVGSDGSSSSLPTYSLREVPLNIRVRESSNLMAGITRETNGSHDKITFRLPDDFSSRVSYVKPTDVCIMEMTVHFDTKVTLQNGATYRHYGERLYFQMEHGKNSNLRESVYHTAHNKGFLSYNSSLSQNELTIRANLQVEPRIMASHGKVYDTMGKTLYNLPIQLSSRFMNVPQVFDTSGETITEYTSIEVTVKEVTLSLSFHRVTYELDRR